MFNHHQTSDTKTHKTRTNANRLEMATRLSIILRRVMEEEILKYKVEMAPSQLDSLLQWLELVRQTKERGCLLICLEALIQQQLLLSLWEMVSINLHNQVNSSNKFCSTWWTVKRIKMKYTLCNKLYKTLRCILDMAKINQLEVCSNLLITRPRWRIWEVWNRTPLRQLSIQIPVQWQRDIQASKSPQSQVLFLIKMEFWWGPTSRKWALFLKSQKLWGSQVQLLI